MPEDGFALAFSQHKNLVARTRRTEQQFVVLEAQTAQIVGLYVVQMARNARSASMNQFDGVLFAPSARTDVVAAIGQRSGLVAVARTANRLSSKNGIVERDGIARSLLCHELHVEVHMRLVCDSWEG